MLTKNWIFKKIIFLRNNIKKIIFMIQWPISHYLNNGCLMVLCEWLNKQWHEIGRLQFLCRILLKKLTISPSPPIVLRRLASHKSAFSPAIMRMRGGTPGIPLCHGACMKRMNIQKRGSNLSMDLNCDRDSECGHNAFFRMQT